MPEHPTAARWFFLMPVVISLGLAPVHAGQAAATQPSPAFDVPATAPASQPTSAPAEDVDKPPPPFGLNSPTMTGNWFGLGDDLQDIGINTMFFYNDTFGSILGGGEQPGAAKNSATVDWFLTFDLGKMGLIPDADILVLAKRGWGYNINEFTGTTRNQDVIDDADGWRDLYIDILWYRQYFLDHKIAVQLGYLDFQTIVDRNAYANSEDKQFMNTALDNNAIIPTAATTGLGGAVTIQPVPWYSLILGAADAQDPNHGAPYSSYKPGFSTAFHDEAWFTSYVENGFAVKIPAAKGPLPGNYRFGLVYEPEPKAVFVRESVPPRTESGDYAFYTSCDQMLFRENDKDDQGLGLFFRYAWRHDDMNRFDQVWSGGCAYTGPLPDRDRDTVGFGFSQLQSSDLFSRNVNRFFGDETVYELYYAITVTPWLVITPDIQYVDNPGANESISHAIVGSVRLRVTF